MTLIVPSYLAKDRSKKKESGRTVGTQHQVVLTILLISGLMFGAVGSRLAYLQIHQGELYREKAENNRIRTVPKLPVRGNLLDRKGKMLATTKFTHAAYIWPKIQKEPSWAENRGLLAKILVIPEAEIQAKVEEAGYESNTPVRIARSLTPQQMTGLEEYRSQLKGIEIDVETVRTYPNGEVGGQVLGYTGELDAKELKKRRPEGYRLGDVVGKMGIESSYEKRLRGEWGGLQMEVDGKGRVTKILGQKQAKPGEDLILTIDLELQKTAQKALGKYKGAIVALDPNTGAVLAMVSNPSFDPNIFSSRFTPAIWKSLQKKDHPFLNRSLRGFPPASTFKIVTDTAGMESGKFPPNTTLYTSAYLRVGGTAFGEWNHAGFGKIGYVRALAMSSNTFHGRIGLGVGGPTLIKWARAYGFGKTTGIELAEETEGLIADDAWKRKRFDDFPWSEGDTVNMSIGQGFTLATPLQIAVMFSVVANGGYIVQPHFLQEDNAEKKQARTNLKLKPSTLQTLKAGTREVVVGGTARALNVPELPPMAGKSGTAQAPPGENHAWFGGYAPFDKPQIVVVAFAEHSGGGGGKTAGPMVKEVMKAFFGVKEKKEAEKKKN
jgi:penicillin-binding protein 2